ncbi:MAG: hypothetical protein IBX62_03035 [Coriobacteriia bacterium]|nr:hypothetical protein [Coriobacteriia bacterium]
MAKKVLLACGALVLSVALIGCQGKVEDTDPGAEAPGGAEPVATGSLPAPTAEDPIVVDEENRAVLVYAEVNRKWVTEPTRHGVVAGNGSNGDKAIFRAGGDALDFHAALTGLGATPGDNVKKDSPAGTAAEGDGLDVTVSWEGASFPIDELVISTGEFGGKALDPKFGGNYEMQSTAKTGCLFCLDTCAAGITSNAAVGWKSFDSGKVEFRGDGDKLPADGTPVVVTFALK